MLKRVLPAVAGFLAVAGFCTGAAMASGTRMADGPAEGPADEKAGADSFVVSPRLDAVMARRSVRDVVIAPDGARIAFTVFENAFDDDTDRTQLWVVAASGTPPRQLTFADTPVGEIAWTADSRSLAFMRDGRLHLIDPAGGEARQAGDTLKDAGNLQFSTDGAYLYYLSETGDDTEAGKKSEARKERYGAYTVVRGDGGYRHLWRIALDDTGLPEGEPEQLTNGRAFSIVDYTLSPDGGRIAFSTWPSPRLVDLLKGRLYLMPAAGGEPALLDDSPGYKSAPVWRADMGAVAYTNGEGFAEYSDIVIRPLDGAPARVIDMTVHDPSLLWFEGDVLRYSASERTDRALFERDLRRDRTRRLSRDGDYVFLPSVSRDGSAFAARLASRTGLEEVALLAGKGRKRQILSDFSAQLDGIDLPAQDLIRWNGDDGLEIEAVLTRPAGFEEGRAYPLYVLTHGGPTGTDRPLAAASPRSIYAPEVLAAEGGGALVLQVNYRGSAGYGEAFQTSNRRNLGLGPARDIIAGVTKLIADGLVDENRIACLGWSQGGHISAMLSTYSTLCTAAIMGAGISDWRTYYYNTDITQFTTQYFRATPLEDDAVYAKTSPVTYIDGAETPVLIQHGENDRRVPIANAYQFRQLLRDKGVPADMVVYAGMGHGPRKPKTRRAIAEHALLWMRHHLFGAEAPDFVAPVPPVEE